MKTGTLEAVSNQATWQEEYTFFDDDDGEPFDLGDVDSITLRVRDPESKSVVLDVELEDGIEIVGDDADGTIQWTVSASSMSALDPKTYQVSLLITNTDDITTQIILGYLPVLEGF